MQVCPACGAEAPDSAKTCAACGARLQENTASFEPVSAFAPGATADLGAETADVPVLVIRKGPDAGERFYLDRSSLTIGRNPASDIFLNDVTVSRSHAVIEVGPDGVTIADAGSLNGTYVGDVCVDKATLKHGDLVQIGRFQLLFLEGGGV
ncbi:FHA domain-containing protein [Coriobacteriia bacterium Es71-Z0120]|uniref:FHA domain-containing protein n=1 Tax=Parvivirga hydrogeniphila TaxID=2939460 RepID=UPI002260D483|nr:FHA domain-containing protein [Parvivirga hydrogeniphila]MCL4079660.1 FHA domain-containing protein [Parvivirga hydrogeniphila]